MTDLLDRSRRSQTEAVPSPGAWFSPIGTGQPSGAPADESVLITLISETRHIVSGGTLAGRMMMENHLLSGTGWETTSSTPPLIIQCISKAPIPTAPSSIHQTAAQSAVAEIRAVSALTNEEIAPLAGVSRRGLQAWVAGETISARKEQRLRSLLDTIRGLAAGDPQKTRARLLDREQGNVRVYDLLAEGRFEQALELALGHRSDTAAPAARQAQNLYSQLSHIEDHVELPPARLDHRFSGRLQR
jgi:DNA-binding transcriptional regulator YiaG